MMTSPARVMTLALASLVGARLCTAAPVTAPACTAKIMMNTSCTSMVRLCCQWRHGSLSGTHCPHGLHLDATALSSVIKHPRSCMWQSKALMSCAMTACVVTAGGRVATARACSWLERDLPCACAGLQQDADHHLAGVLRTVCRGGRARVRCLGVQGRLCATLRGPGDPQLPPEAARAGTT